MEKNRIPVFISYDYEHDKHLYGSLAEQASRSSSPMYISNHSLDKPVDDNWEKEVESRIAKVHMVFVICGRNVHNALGVTKEIQMAYRLKKTVHLLDPGAAGRSRPKGVPETQPFIGMDWGTLEKTIHVHG